jgi:molybdate transport system substrate-binding protein
MAVLLRLVLVLCCCASLRAGDGTGLTVFAAASTADALTAIGKAFERSGGATVAFSFAASSTLAKQIEHGAPADLFLSADQAWMDYLAGKQAIRAGSRRDLLGNRLVLVAPAGAVPVLTVAPGFAVGAAFSGRLAIADPAHVPAGIYAKQALAALGWWTELEPRLAPAADVRAALRLVELGEAGLGVVYASDAVGSVTVAVAGAIPAALHAPIRYPVALTAGARGGAAEFLAFLGGREAAAVFAAHGFTVLVPAP